MLGFPERALARADESIARARKLSHPPSVIHALYYATILHHFRRDIAAAREKTESLLEVARDRSIGWAHYATLHMALISALEGEQQARAGTTTIQEALAAELSGDVEGKGFGVCLFAGICALSGEVDAGLNALEAATAEATATGACLWE